MTDEQYIRHLEQELCEAREFQLKLAERIYLAFEILSRLAERKSDKSGLPRIHQDQGEAVTADGV